MEGVTQDVAAAAMLLAARKLSVPTKFVTRTHAEA
jgi:ribosomal protein L16/L10AE